MIARASHWVIAIRFIRYTIIANARVKIVIIEFTSIEIYRHLWRTTQVVIVVLNVNSCTPRSVTEPNLCGIGKRTKCR